MYDFLQTSLNLPYRVNLSNLTEIRHTNGSVKHIRRVQQAPYPLTKVTPDVELFGNLDQIERMQSNTVTRSRHNLYQMPSTSKSESNEIVQKPTITTSTKTKKLFPNLVKSKQQTASTSNDCTQTAHHAPSSSNSSKLARHIFNNLNIFSNKHQNDQQNSSSAPQIKQTASNTNNTKQEQIRGASRIRNLEIGQNVRRLSSKSNSSTASTQNLIVSRRCRRSYRSQDDDFYLETDGSSCYSTNNSSTSGRDGFGIRRPSVDTISTYLSHESNDRLQYGSTDTTFTGDDDDVFLPQQHKMNGSIVGVDADSDMISRFVNVVHPPEWPNYRPCVICLEELQAQKGSTNPAVSLIRCEHLMHLSCLNHLIISQSEQQKNLSASNGNSPTLYIECPVCGIVYGEKYGNQPPGTMTWSIIPKQLAGHEGQNTIQIIYK